MKIGQNINFDDIVLNKKFMKQIVSYLAIFDELFVFQTTKY